MKVTRFQIIHKFIVSYKVIAVFLVLIYCNVSGQTIDSAYLKAKYQMQYRPDSNKLNSFSKDVFILEIGHKFSKFYSYYKFFTDSMLTAEYNKQDGEKASSLSVTTKGLPASGSSKVVYRNIHTNVYTVTQDLIMNNYRYIDSINNMSWAIKKDTATISGYKCTRATTKFRGRDYNAWFSMEIPISAGPYLFAGLPGLIVEIKDTKGDFTFSLLSVESCKEKIPIEYKSNKSVLVSRKNYRKLVRMMNDDIDAFAASQGMMFKTKSINGVENPPPAPRPPYNPIELE